MHSEHRNILTVPDGLHSFGRLWDRFLVIYFNIIKLKIRDLFAAVIFQQIVDAELAFTFARKCLFERSVGFGINLILITPVCGFLLLLCRTA